MYVLSHPNFVSTRDLQPADLDIAVPCSAQPPTCADWQVNRDNQTIEEGADCGQQRTSNYRNKPCCEYRKSSGCDMWKDAVLFSFQTAAGNGPGPSVVRLGLDPRSPWLKSIYAPVCLGSCRCSVPRKPVLLKKKKPRSILSSAEDRL